MAVVLIADAHLGGPGGPAGPLVEQLRSLPERGCRHLILLGDLFHVWVAHPRFETSEVREVVPVLGQLREAGLRLSYVEGNRDFFLAGSSYAPLFDAVGGEESFSANGRRYLAVHGDGLNPRDWRYRFWSSVSKSAPSRFLAPRLPERLARGIVASTERQLAKTNFEHKVRIPEEVLRRYGERRLEEGYDVLLLGHFHRERRFEVEGGEVWILEPWFESRSPVWIGGEGG
jgi:UDP-2,3-diacylglucosamine hydrolase